MSHSPSPSPAPSAAPAAGPGRGAPPSPTLTLVGGALMGLANIIPGVSGGTMILALGLYEEFIDAVAGVTSLRRSLRPYVFLAMLGAAAVVAIGLLATPIKWALSQHHAPTFALFIGLALGGVPLIWKELRPVRTTGWIGAALGLATMIVVSLLLSEFDIPRTRLVYFVAGVIAASAMVLPGISGSHLLLVMGLYGSVIAAIEVFKDGLRALDWAAVLPPVLDVGGPLGLGILVGIGGISNLMEWLLKRYHQGTMGLLLGLLVGSVIPLDPFRAPGPKDLFTDAAPMTAGNLALVGAMIVAGFLATQLIGRLDRRPPKAA